MRAGRSIPVVQAVWDRLDRVRFAAARKKADIKYTTSMKDESSAVNKLGARTWAKITRALSVSM